MPTALEGMRVLDLSSLFSAPQIAASLGELGADVVKLEPRSGDPLRRIGAARGNKSLMWALVSRNKRAITLDLETPRGQQLFRELVRRADVLVENQPRALLERWHATYPELSALNPRLVVVSVSGFGAAGPYQDRVGAGSLAEAFAGLTHMTGEAEGPPLLSSLPIGDVMTAMSGVIGALAACYHRDARGGSGQHVDVSMYEPVLQLMAGSVIAHEAGSASPQRAGSRMAGGVPRNVYRARDGRWVALSATTDAQVARILAGIGRSDDAARARFGASADRLEHADELDALVAGWVSERDSSEVLARFESWRIPVAPVNDLEAIAADLHVRARGSLVEVEDPELGSLTLVAPSPRLGATPAAVRHTGPALGEHNVEVYAEWLGLSAHEVATLCEDEIV
jgi:crotonobetainyl-CoA:carnitine CoA-transferase CaiB-like acyl-CoA transferase